MLVAGLFHETHTFLDGLTPRTAFQERRGQAILAAMGDGSPMAGFLEIAERHDLDVIPSIDLRASPSATVSDDVVEHFLSQLDDDLREATREAPLDAIFLVLHGAMVSETILDVETTVLERIHAFLGEMRPPIFGVYDLHANLGPGTADLAEGLVAYRNNPHTDAHESAMRAARHLVRALDHEVAPTMTMRRVPIVWPPTGTGTDDEPMRSLQAQARLLERTHHALWEVNVVPGFAYADTPVAGLTLSCISDPGPEAALTAATILDELATLAMAKRNEGYRRPRDVDDVLDTILPVHEGPVLLVESVDNIGGGAPGDATGVLRKLIERNVPSCLVAINDPDAVTECAQRRIGDTVRVAVGGRGSRFDAGPIHLDVEVIHRSDGRFELEDRHSHMASMGGIHVDMGATAVVRHGGITILLTSRKTAPFDLGQYRSQGIEPTEYAIIVVKAAVAHRRAYDPIARGQYWVASPGPCPDDLTTLPYRHVDPAHVSPDAPSKGAA